ncbi:MAG: hypothetical protein L6R48_15530 [Planctomycetes bacterium]|nr:hypothetical protein [Planctomycetota bacterium]
MTVPADHAATLLRWTAGRSADAIERELDDPGHALFAHADALADAADSDDEALRGAGLAALFGGLVEPLNDGFTPAGRAAYARLFTRVVWRACARDARLAAALAAADIRDEGALQRRFHAIRHDTRPGPKPVRRALVLSRVTIGADVLLTSVALQRLHQAHPGAELVLLGDGKLQALLGGLPKVRVRPLSYARRGPLRERLASWLGVAAAVAEEAPDLVLAPDSRLDQLGILPVCEAGRYLLWENTRPEGEAPSSLAGQLDRWLARRLALPAAPACLPRVALDPATAAVGARLATEFGPAPLAAVKLDHGGNPAKALPRAAEIEILATLRARGWRVLLDRGFGAEELANSDALLAACGWQAVDLDDSGKGLGRPLDQLAAGSLAQTPVLRFHGSIGGWAAALAGCRLAVSYDSVGHHLAAALGVPLVTAFTGHADPAFAVAWQPRGPAAVTVVEIPTAAKGDPAQWQRVLAALPAAPLSVP